MLDIPNIRAVLDTASRWDMDLAQFACWGHAHLLNPVLPPEELAAWEELTQVTLPEDYRAYLTQLGNGGAGPAYGLFPLSLPKDEFAQYLQQPCIYSDGQEEKFQDVVQRFVHWEDFDDDWSLYLDYFPDTPSWKDQRWQNEHRKEWGDELDRLIDQTIIFPLLHYGQYQITNEGCSGDIFIILNGSHRGYIHCATADCDAGLAFREPRTFATYKEDYLKRTFADYFMEYVNRTEDVCNNLSAETRQKFQRERAQARDFLAAVQARDWDGVVKLLNAIEDPAALSTKSKSLYIHYDENHLLSPLSTNPAVKRFYDKLYGRHGRDHGNWVTWVQCHDPAETHRAPYPRPTFEAFAQTFFDP
ncbi:SMI1/KNR4 family protein [Flintibacter muris]|uniref:SMI1/KNR4 family protein n=1 Tax=Flintibacter muris TaxID=2941327 RepID=UPI00203B7B33|nr:SMI1/KNR4 family protein [Flintibacter muris]